MPIQIFYNDIKYFKFFLKIWLNIRRREEQLMIKNIQISNGKFSLLYEILCLKNHTKHGRSDGQYVDDPVSFNKLIPNVPWIS